MSEPSERAALPRRDTEGRIVAYGDLLGVGLAGLVIGLLALLVLDWGFATVGAGDFGRANGWLAVILPAWLYWEDFRAWGFGFARVVAALAAGVLGVVGGLLVAGLATGMPPLVTGVLAAAAFTLLYGTVWFHGVRWLARRTG
jgi:hypothetical protein